MYFSVENNSIIINCGKKTYDFIEKFSEKIPIKMSLLGSELRWKIKSKKVFSMKNIAFKSSEKIDLKNILIFRKF